MYFNEMSQEHLRIIISRDDACVYVLHGKSSEVKRKDFSLCTRILLPGKCVREKLMFYSNPRKGGVPHVLYRFKHEPTVINGNR